MHFSILIYGWAYLGHKMQGLSIYSGKVKQPFFVSLSPIY
jgi:hypothetical protein